MVSEPRKVPPFASGHSRAQWVSISLALVVVLDIVAVISDYMQVQLVERAISGQTITIAEALANDSRQANIGTGQLVLLIITAILFLMWIHQAHRNLPSLGAGGLKYSPGWAVGWFFIPILSLWRPFQVTTEIWKASEPTIDTSDGVAWQNAPTSPLIASWWILWLIGGFVGNILLQVGLSAETLSELQTTSWLTLATDSVEIPAAILAILVIRNIGLRQSEKQKHITSQLSGSQTGTKLSR